MDSTDKYVLMGAFATGLADAALEGYWTYMAAQGKPIRGQFPYILIPGLEWLPPLDDLLTWFGVPTLLYAGGKLLKNPKLAQMAKGGAIYGVSAFVGQTTVRVAHVAQNKAATYSYVLRG